MYSDIENNIKCCSSCLDFWWTQPKERIIHHEIQGKPWEVTGTDMFSLHNKHYLCIVDYHSKFPVIKRTESLLADRLILAWKVIFLECDTFGNSGFSQVFR